MSKSITITQNNLNHTVKFFKTPSEFILACIPKCCSSYYAWSIFASKYPSAKKILEKGGENIKSLNNKDGLFFSKYILKEDIKEEQVILPFRDPMDRFISIFLYLQDVSEDEIIGDSIDGEIKKIVVESNNNQNVFFDYFINEWKRISIAIPQNAYYTSNTTILPYNDTHKICKLINSAYISQVINEGTGNKQYISLSNSQINKIKEIYKEDFKLQRCVK